MPQPIASRLVTDAYQILWQCYLPDARIMAQFASWFIKVQTDDFNDASRFYRFTIPPPKLDSPVPQPGPYLFHCAGVKNQFNQSPLHFMPRVSPVPRSEACSSKSSASSSNEDKLQPGSSSNGNWYPNWSDAETRFLSEL